MRLFHRDKPKIKLDSTKTENFNGWLKCTRCHDMIHTNELEHHSHCCPKCDYHYRLSAQQRIDSLADPDSFKEYFTNILPTDPLEFVDREPYPDRLQRAQQQSGRSEAIAVGLCTIENRPVALGVLDFQFMAGSMGSVVGERLTCLIEHALHHRIPLVIVSASGGARMQESILSLMQMAKTSAALAKLHDAGVLYVSILTDPTSGGVTASFASLGDVILAEPGALVGFAGPRVVEQVIRQKLPAGAQTSEFLLEHGMIDAVVPRHDLRKKLLFLIDYFHTQDVSAN